MTKAQDPYSEQEISRQLDSWAAALEMAVATLNQTLVEVKGFNGKEADERDDGTAGPVGSGGGG